MSGPFAPDVSGPQFGDDKPPAMYVVRSPCCNRRVLVEGWEVAYARWYNAGKVNLRCGSVLDTPGWRPERDRVQGCGETFVVAADEVTTTL